MGLVTSNMDEVKCGDLIPQSGVSIFSILNSKLYHYLETGKRIKNMYFKFGSTQLVVFMVKIPLVLCFAFLSKDLVVKTVRSPHLIVLW